MSKYPKYVMPILVVALAIGVVLSFATAKGAETEQVVSGERKPALEQYTLDECERLTGKKITKFNEAPMLKEKVDTGELPPVEKRLPDKPVVLSVDEIGKYGGTWRRAQAGEIDWVWFLVNFESFGIFDVYQEKMVPELAEWWKFNEDYTELTVRFHEGIKWSDGVPLTVDDCIFWWEEVVLGKDEHGSDSPWNWLLQPWTVVGGKPMKIEKIDDITMKFKFAAPNPTAPLWFQTGPHFVYVWPTHYVKKFHPNYNPEIDNWEAMQTTLRNHGTKNPDQPTLSPWKTVSYVPGERLILERNPYFWKIDQKGNQLPYIDRVWIEYLSDIETLKLKLVSGEVDFQIRDELSSADYPLLFDNQKTGDYTVKLFHTGRGAQPCLFPNLNHKDDKLRLFFRNQKVRIALSTGIDREYINKMMYNDLMEPCSATFGADSWHFKVKGGPELLKEWQQKYSEYDPEKANKLLDEAGYEKGSDGWRQFPDGTKLKFICMLNVLDQNKKYIDVMQLIKENWAELGIEVIMDDVSNDEYWSTVDGREYDMYVYESSDLDCFAWPAGLFPVVHWRTWPEVTYWFKTGGEQGIDPEYYANRGEGDAEVRLLDLYKKVLTLPGDPDAFERHKLIHEAIRIHIDEGPFMIGIVGEPTIPGILKNNFKNVGDFCVTGPHWMNAPRNMYPEQFYFAE